MADRRWGSSRTPVGHTPNEDPWRRPQILPQSLSGIRLFSPRDMAKLSGHSHAMTGDGNKIPSSDPLFSLRRFFVHLGARLRCWVRMGKVGVATRIYAPECSYLAWLPGVCWGGDPGARTGLLRSPRDEGDSDKRAPPVGEQADARAGPRVWSGLLLTGRSRRPVHGVGLARLRG
jgi:hypothetical protein